MQGFFTIVLGLDELCLKLRVLRYAGNSWICNYYVLCSHYAQLCNGI